MDKYDMEKADKEVLKKFAPPLRHPSSERFHEILLELGALHDSKQKDYGTDEDPFHNVRQAGKDWGVPAWVAAMIRASDKVRRLQSFARKGSLANESVYDSLRDLAVYAVIAQVLMEEEGAPILNSPVTPYGEGLLKGSDAEAWNIITDVCSDPRCNCRRGSNGSC